MWGSCVFDPLFLALKVEVDDEALEIIVEAYFLQGQEMVRRGRKHPLFNVWQKVKKVGSS